MHVRFMTFNPLLEGQKVKIVIVCDQFVQLFRSFRSSIQHLFASQLRPSCTVTLMFPVLGDVDILLSLPPSRLVRWILPHNVLLTHLKRYLVCTVSAVCDVVLQSISYFNFSAHLPPSHFMNKIDLLEYLLYCNTFTVPYLHTTCKEKYITCL